MRLPLVLWKRQSLGIQSSSRVPRRPDQAPWLYFAGATYYLMELDGEWLIVNGSSWIT
jgi:hypothetical protein